MENQENGPVQEQVEDTRAVDRIAKITHEMNRRWCELNGDGSQTSWEDAPQWQRDSARDGVCFHLRNPHAPASAGHDNWLREKVQAGWVWAPEKDAELRTHPCIVPFEQLPPMQQFKDVMFSAIVHALSK